jgi:GTP-binding protein HflX
MAIEAAMEQQLQPLTVKLPYARGDLLSLFHERGQVGHEDHLADGVVVDGRIPGRLIPYFDEYRVIQG